MTWGPNIANINSDEWLAVQQAKKWLEAYERIMLADPMPFHDHSPVAAQTNELRYDGVSYMRKLVRSIEDACHHRAQVYNIHAQMEGRWSPQ